MKITSTQLTIVASIVLFGGIISFGLYSTTRSAKGEELVPFAQCLKDKGAEFYGAFWCSHCQTQKGIFGTAAKSLPYIECSTANMNGQLDVCTAKAVKSYPTWRFADGSMHVGEMTLADLAEKTSCSLPVSVVSATSTANQATSTSSEAKILPVTNNL